MRSKNKFSFENSGKLDKVGGTLKGLMIPKTASFCSNSPIHMGELVIKRRSLMTIDIIMYVLAPIRLLSIFVKSNKICK